MTAQNSKIKQKGKPRGRPIAKGQVLNPGGRPKITPEEIDLIAACKTKTPAALAVIEALMATANNAAVRLNAASYIIERGYGKAVQPTSVSGGIELNLTGLSWLKQTVQARNLA